MKKPKNRYKLFTAAVITLTLFTVFFVVLWMHSVIKAPKAKESPAVNTSYPAMPKEMFSEAPVFITTFSPEATPSPTPLISETFPASMTSETDTPMPPSTSFPLTPLPVTETPMLPKITPLPIATRTPTAPPQITPPWVMLSSIITPPPELTLPPTVAPIITTPPIHEATPMITPLPVTSAN